MRAFFLCSPSPALLFFIPLPHLLSPPMIPLPCSHSFSLLSLCAVFMPPVCMFVCMRLDSYVMQHLMCCYCALACLGFVDLCISASVPPDSYLNPVVISMARSHSSLQLSHYSSVPATCSYMLCVQHLTVGAKNNLSHVLNMRYEENMHSYD